MKCFFTTYLLYLTIAFSGVSLSQTCIDLPNIDGAPASFVSPTGWNIWNSSPDIITGNGSYPGTSLANIQEVNGSSLAGGEMAFFLINGVLGADTEGISTLLNGLVPGTFYSVSVEWQQAKLDYTGISLDPEGGMLGVYLDGNLVQLFTSSGSLDDSWQIATISFVASATSHTFALKGELLPDSGRGAIVVDNLPCLIFLALDIVNFRVSRTTERFVNLSWEMSSDKAFDYIEIERSSDLENWSLITTVYETGEKEYAYNDAEPSKEQAYYRLKEYDMDGAYAYSEIRSVDKKKAFNSKIILFPNPATDILFIEGAESESVNISDVSGRSIDLNKLIVSESETSITLNITSLAEGTYIVHSGSETEVLVKQ